jgi:recombination DNA repair RAD52 pathway protein
VDVAEIQEAITDELKKAQKRNFWQLFGNCMTTQKPAYFAMELILNLKKKLFVFLTCL